MSPTFAMQVAAEPRPQAMPSPLVPRKGIVRPRAVSPGSGEVLPLEDIIASLRERHRDGLIQIIGGPGRGKTTALEHLAAVLPDTSSLEFCGYGAGSKSLELPPPRLIIGTRTTGESPLDRPRIVASCLLAPWGADEWMEYLWAVHKPQCASVMNRLRDDPHTGRLEGIPELWRPVLDIMAGDELVPSAEAALMKLLDESLSDSKLRTKLTSTCFQMVCIPLSVPEMLEPFRADADPWLLRLCRHELSRLILAGFGIVGALDSGPKALEPLLSLPWPPGLVDRAARLATLDIQDHLREILATGDPDLHAMAASLLFARDRRWMPPLGRQLKLSHGHFRGARWESCDLRRLLCTGADLRSANLCDSNLDASLLLTGRFSSACLRRARLCYCFANRADFSYADLTSCIAEQTDFVMANLTGAILSGAKLRKCTFDEANLTDAQLSGADLMHACFRKASMTGANLSEAQCYGANFESVNLEGAVLAGACFIHCRFTNCAMEGVDLSRLNFSQSHFEGALLSGSRAHFANFHGANFQAAGLADVDWENADLSDADLRHCSFHLGSSRSGLVGSPIACEGSRTGFYTDDYNEQGFKSPEEIRKANLRGCDLRGAKIDGVDFYLVDLRNARYTPEQERQFRQCGAILECPCDDRD